MNAETELSAANIITLLSRLIRKIGPLTPNIGGQIAFSIEGAGGGEWVVDLDHPGGAWLGPDETNVSPSIQIFATEVAFRSLFFQPENVPIFIMTGELRVEGDPDKLDQVGGHFTAGGSFLKHRIRQAKDVPNKKRRRR